MNTINESKVRTVPFYKDENYTVYEDGRMFSHYQNKFLKISVAGKDRAQYGKFGPCGRIVWQSFHGELDKSVVVSYKDGDCSNFRLDNLYIRTRSEMIADNHANKTTHYPSLLLDDEKINLLLAGISNQLSISELSKILDCSTSHIYGLLTGRSVKWFYDKYGPFDYYEPLRKPHERSGKYIGRNKKKSHCYTPYKHKHGSRKPAVIKDLCFGLRSAVCNINSIADIKHKFDISTYQAVKLKQCAKGDEA